MVCWGVGWIHLAEDRDQEWAVVHVVLNVQALLHNKFCNNNNNNNNVLIIMQQKYYKQKKTENSDYVVNLRRQQATYISLPNIDKTKIH
jgi:hypothetical protein